MKGLRFSILTLISVSSFSFGQETAVQVLLDSVQNLDEVIIKANTILGNQYVAQNRTGAAYYLSSEELKKFAPTDVNRALRAVPGVNFYEEDGFGLRPNISLRGTSPQRSSKITLMEDGVLIAPAPYSSPAAYYFPSIARMHAVEILKGSSQVQYGPYTTGGAINLVSTPVPNTLTAQMRTSTGSYQTGQVYSSVGQSTENKGYLIEFLRLHSNGFKQLPNNENTGFDVYDMMGKFRFSNAKKAAIPQSVELKYQWYKEDANETYLGLTEGDFNKTPYARYAASQTDHMNANKTQWLLTHEVDFSAFFKVVTNVYYHTFSRNWYKLDDVIYQGEKQNLAAVIQTPAAFPNHLNILKGSTNSDVDALLVKANNRTYYSRGVQTKMDYHWYGSKGGFHDLEVGGRIHYDEEDRFQWEDGYRIINGGMVLTSMGARGAQGNRISSANAFAAYALYTYKWNGLTLTPGIRYENMTLARRDFGNNDPNRTGVALSNRKNQVDVFIPGIGFNYRISKHISLFGGVHKGFSPPGNNPGEQAEKSVNYELGSRFGAGRFRGELIGFFNDYSNLLGSDMAATGGSGSLEQFNAGAVHVRGFEFLLQSNLSKEHSNIQTPIALAYTLTNAVFQNDFGSSQDIWGVVREGDQVPYIPKHQASLTTSLVCKKFELHLSTRYNGIFTTQASNGGVNDSMPLDGHLIVDFSGKLFLSSHVSTTVQIINLFDTVYAASRVPAGFRPGHPFGVQMGATIRL